MYVMYEVQPRTEPRTDTINNGIIIRRYEDY